MASHGEVRVLILFLLIVTARLDHGLTKHLRLKQRLRCGPGGRLLEWHPRTALREEPGRTPRAIGAIRISTFGV
ncbi:MAG: hypothetical protein E6K66_11585 [Nitrospirae bacterium]|nr:MAG: hypothetical protein E6K66_11585 [Nitrospirota bacterium]